MCDNDLEGEWQREVTSLPEVPSHTPFVLNLPQEKFEGISLNLKARRMVWGLEGTSAVPLK